MAIHLSPARVLVAVLTQYLYYQAPSRKTELVARVVYPPHNADHKGSALHFKILNCYGDYNISRGGVWSAS